MYTQRLKQVREQYHETIKNKVLSNKQLDDMIFGFCNKEDIHGVLQEDVFRLFDEYCRENGYPIISHKAVGHAFHRLWGVQSKCVRVHDTIKKIYFYSENVK